MDFNLTDEQQFIKQTVRDFAEKEITPRAQAIDETGEFPHDIFGKMAGLGLLGLPFPEQYGGADADTVSLALWLDRAPLRLGCWVNSYAGAR